MLEPEVVGSPEVGNHRQCVDHVKENCCRSLRPHSRVRNGNEEPPMLAPRAAMSKRLVGYVEIVGFQEQHGQ
eukprot:12048061-Heterocapsa_arctica.AAC.1